MCLLSLLSALVTAKQNIQFTPGGKYNIQIKLQLDVDISQSKGLPDKSAILMSRYVTGMVNRVVCRQCGLPEVVVHV